MSRLASNLRYLLDEVAKISENALSAETGVPQPTINRILSGKSRDPRDSTIEPIARYFRVSVEAMRREDLRETRKPQGRSRIAVDSDLLRQAILKSEQWIAEQNLTTKISSEDRAEVVLAIYEGLQEGVGMKQTERFVNGMLRAIARGADIS